MKGRDARIASPLISHALVNPRGNVVHSLIGGRGTRVTTVDGVNTTGSPLCRAIVSAPGGGGAAGSREDALRRRYAAYTA
jgi:hypothetical protein